LRSVVGVHRPPHGAAAGKGRPRCAAAAAAATAATAATAAAAAATVGVAGPHHAVGSPVAGGPTAHRGGPRGDTRRARHACRPARPSAGGVAKATWCGGIGEGLDAGATTSAGGAARADRTSAAELRARRLQARAQWVQTMDGKNPYFLHRHVINP